MKKKALITGITGQDGSYLAELLLEKKYQVHGLIRRSSSFNTKRIEHLYKDKHKKNNKLFLHYSDLTDPLSLSHIIAKIKPEEIYNLAAQSHVGVSFIQPDYTANVDALGTLRILEAIKKHKINTKFYQASSSELFGKVQEIPQSETTPFYPRSPYAVAKAFSFWITKNYREAYNIFAANGILFNHESPRRGQTFVTRKITRGLTKIKLGIENCLYLGNLEAKRDWGYAPDFVKGMWLILQQDKPDDFILATGKTYSVRECVEITAKCLNINIKWKGTGINEIGIDNKTNKTIIKIDPAYFRPTEVDILIGDYSKAKNILNWKPSTNFHSLIDIMVKAEIKELNK